MATTVKDFTDDVTEIKYGDSGPYMLAIRDLINKAGIDIYNKYSYDDINLYDEGVITDDFLEKINIGNYMNGYVVLGHYDGLDE